MAATSDHQSGADPEGPRRQPLPRPVPDTVLQNRQLHPRSVLFWQVENGALAIVLAGLLVGSFWVSWPPTPWLGWARGVLTLGLVFTLLEAAVLIPRRYRFYRYALTTEALLVERGGLFRRRRVYPLSRILYSETRQGPILRWFGLYTVRAATIIESAAIGPISKDEAERFEHMIRDHTP